MKKPVLKPTLPPLLIVIIDSALMIAGAKMPEWLMGAILGAAVIWLIISTASVRGNLIERWPRLRDWFPFLDPTGGMARQAELAERFVSGKTLRLLDAAINGTIVGKTFEDCIIYGPAVIAPCGMTTFRNPRWHATRGDIVYDFGDKSTRTGMLLTEDCTFNNCTFYECGIASSRAEFLKGIERIVGEDESTQDTSGD